MPKQKLFDNDSEEEVEIKTENEYAKKYDKWRGKEEIHKLEQKYGTKVLNSDASISSDSEDESDEPPEVSEEMETQFLKTLALLKKKDPRIYDPQFKFFDEKEKESVKEPKEKTLTFADSDEEDDDDDNIFSIEKKAVVDEQVPEKESTKNSGNRNDQDVQLKDYLMGKVQHADSSAVNDLEPLKALWSDPKLNEGEAFLRDYILNKKYLEEGEAGEAGEVGDRVRDDDELGADELMVEEQDKFERAFNFRFEEPDQEYLKRFPRTMNYIRPKDERRSKKRAEVRTRKEDEKTRKMDEIARLKALKLQEIHEKIARIKEVTGNDELAFKDEDIEGDFDPLEHDRRMRAIFDEEYYGEADAEKPVFPDLDKELEIEDWEHYSPGEAREAQDFGPDEPHCEDAEFNMDADYDPKSGRASLIEEMRKSLGKKRRTRRNKSQLAALLAARKPAFLPQQDSYAQYMDEYYKMDCEDVIGGDLPTRFKYREVVPNDYGLTIEEILLADDKELTQWVPLKKLVRHKPESVQKSEINAYAQKAADPRLKRKILPSLFKNLPEEPELVSAEENSKKKKKKNKKTKQKDTIEEGPEITASAEDAEDIEPNADENSEQNPEDDEVSEQKVDKKKAKRKEKIASQNALMSSQVESSDSSIAAVKDSVEVNYNVGKKYKKNKNKDMRVENTSSHVKATEINDGTNVAKVNKKKVVQITNGGCKVELKENTNKEVNTSELSKRQKKNLRKKLMKKGIVVENVKNATPSSNSQDKKKRNLSESEQVPNKKHKNNSSFTKVDQNSKVPLSKAEQNNKEALNKEDHKNGKASNKKGQTNKIRLNKDEQRNKGPLNKDFKSKDKFKNKNKKHNNQFKNKIKQIIDKNKSSDNTDSPMSNLSDERLKAYGLNPKKYRSFLKYKKF